MKDWIVFFLSLPFFLAGLAWEWVCDYFGRGRAYYDLFNRD